MTPDPLDRLEQEAWKKLDQTRRIHEHPADCLCRQDDAMTTPLDLEDVE